MSAQVAQNWSWTPATPTSCLQQCGPFDDSLGPSKAGVRGVGCTSPMTGATLGRSALQRMAFQKANLGAWAWPSALPIQTWCMPWWNLQIMPSTDPTMEVAASHAVPPTMRLATALFTTQKSMQILPIRTMSTAFGAWCQSQPMEGARSTSSFPTVGSTLITMRCTSIPLTLNTSSTETMGG